MTGYLYDADGTRVAKGTITSMSCDPAVNGFQTTSDYVLGLSGEQVTEVGVNADGSLAHQHTNAWAGGKLLGTYDNDGLHFYLDDPLGTRRVQTDSAGVVEQQCASLPYGNGESCTATPTEHLFTGKERDAESGLDYFGARYYGSSMGRFMSPDYNESGEKPDPIPYADFRDPQSLNLYSYGGNNPLSQVDADGHYHCDPDTSSTGKDGVLTVTAGACHLDFSDYVDFFRHMTRSDAKQIGIGILHETASYFDNTKNCPNCKVGIMPVGMIEGFGAKSIVTILEEDGTAIHAVVETAKGPIEVMANTSKEGDTLVLSKVHVGEGTRLTGGEMKAAARELGQKEGVSAVRVEGGVRTGGAHAGTEFKPFTVQVK